MARYWTSYWKGKNWLDNSEYSPVDNSGSNLFRKRGVVPDDTVYIICVQGGRLYLGGRMQVEKIISRSEAARLRKKDDLYEAPEWIVGREGTPLNLHRVLDSSLTAELRFTAGGLESPPTFRKGTGYLDGQTFRNLRELTPQSARLLDEVIEATDALPRDGKTIAVSREMLNNRAADEALPNQIPESYEEGAGAWVLINRYERNKSARTACIRHHGLSCAVCGINLAEKYGKVAYDFIHVHHLIPLASIAASYRVDPVKDLRPICPTCHAIVHRRDPAYSIEEVCEFLTANRKC